LSTDASSGELGSQDNSIGRSSSALVGSQIDSFVGYHVEDDETFLRPGSLRSDQLVSCRHGICATDPDYRRPFDAKYIKEIFFHGAALQ